MKNPLVSIIMPCFNCDRYISLAIFSVLDQSYSNWELIIIDDGSTDDTFSVIENFTDSRIKQVKLTSNKGVSYARNVGLKNMKGDYFCFLDADDLYPKESLTSRLAIFSQYSDLSFVDGKVNYVDEFQNPIMEKEYIPGFWGEPIDKLLRLDKSCLFGNTWMIKREADMKYKFETDLTHTEDLFFYLTICEGKKYGYTRKEVLFYRQRSNSAMKDLFGLEVGYEKLLLKVKEKFRDRDLKYLKWRIIRIMFLSWLIDGRNPIKAIRSVFRYLGT